MVSTWTPNTEYYVLLNKGQLKQSLGKILEDIVGYKPRKDKQEWLLEHCMRGVKYLEGNKGAINIQISNKLYADYTMPNGENMNIQNVKYHITSQDFDLAMYMFGVDEFLTQKEYNNLIEVKL